MSVAQQLPQTLTLIRGLPGSGKSTRAKYLVDTHSAHGGDELVHLEADMFFINSAGEYQYDRRILRTAHDWCYANTIKQLRAGNSVVVSNTFSRLWELERYLAIPALLPNVNIVVTEMKTQFQNIHGCPDSKIEEMATRWENLPDDWKMALTAYLTVS